MSFLGGLRSSNASVELQILPPKGKDGSSIDLEPVAITTVSVDMRTVPSVVVTSTVFPSTKFARPFMCWTFTFFRSPATPYVSLSTIPFFQSIVFEKSISGAPARMPNEFSFVFSFAL